MGLFGFLFGNKTPSTVETLCDRVWISQLAKFTGVGNELQKRSDLNSDAVLLIAHFDDTLDRLNSIAAEYGGSTPVTATLAQRLSVDIAAGLNLDETARIDFIVAERHPLTSVDDQLMEFAEELPCRCRMTHHLSLEDPLLMMFFDEPVKRILKSMGMTEDESIESGMVSRRIRAAQKKLDAMAFSNTDAHSAAEWMEINIADA